MLDFLCRNVCSLAIRGVGAAPGGRVGASPRHRGVQAEAGSVLIFSKPSPPCGCGFGVRGWLQTSGQGQIHGQRRHHRAAAADSLAAARCRLRREPRRPSPAPPHEAASQGLAEAHVGALSGCWCSAHRSRTVQPILKGPFPGEPGAGASSQALVCSLAGVRDPHQG